MDAARQAWLAEHPYLAPLARLQRAVEEAAARGGPVAPTPRWDPLAQDLAAGVPLLCSASAGPGLAAAAADQLRLIVEGLPEAPLPRVASACRELCETIGRAPAGWREVMSWILDAGSGAPAPTHPGLLTFLGWTAVRRVLQAGAADPGRGDGEPSERRDCPVCGALPSMAQLVSAESARRRLLVCGRCGTRWTFRRIGCPFCGNDTPDRLSVLHVERDERLRIDVCEECGGYVKTYAGEGEEELFLADWPTLHLDLLARDRGLCRVGASLYELPEDERRDEP